MCYWNVPERHSDCWWEGSQCSLVRMIRPLLYTFVCALARSQFSVLFCSSLKYALACLLIFNWLMFVLGCFRVLFSNLGFHCLSSLGSNSLDLPIAKSPSKKTFRRPETNKKDQCTSAVKIFLARKIFLQLHFVSFYCMLSIAQCPQRKLLNESKDQLNSDSLVVVSFYCCVAIINNDTQR